VSDKFRVGERVRVKQEHPEGNPRTPQYVRGKSGIISAVYEAIENPLDHRGVYPPLYTVKFELNELFGTPTHDTLWVDLHEDWLESI
jgi:nitrile hydratase